MTPPPPRVVAVDVDGTLVTRGVVNQRLAAWCRARKADGFVLMLWSSRGAEYARGAADLAGLADCFDLVLGKPGYIVDDQGWGWTRYTKVVRRLDT